MGEFLVSCLVMATKTVKISNSSLSLSRNKVIISKHYSIKVIVDRKLCPCVSQNKDLFCDVLAFMEAKALKITVITERLSSCLLF